MANCSDSFPSTEVFYAEISSDIPVIVLLALACVLTIVIIGIFLEEHLYLQKVHDNDPIRQRRVITLLGLYPVVSLMALFSLLVPACTQLVDLIASCYLSVCIYMFVYLMVEYFGGDEKMVAALADDKIRMNTPPCCCCCVCLPRITLTRKHLRYIKILALQVAIVRPMLLFIAAVLWTDGKYVQGEVDPSSPSLYISILSVVSTLLSMFALMVILQATKIRMKHQMLAMKGFAVKLAVILTNVQSLIFGFMAKYDVPPCLGSRGAKVRGSNISHGVLVVEIFLLSLVARFAYRRPEPLAGDNNKHVEANVDIDLQVQGESKIKNSSKTELDEISDYGTKGKYTAYENPVATE